jgi:hypothetical protein
MYAKDGRLFVPKGYMSLEAFLESYNKISSATEVIIHFRLASCGKVVPEQTHPMFINDGLAFCHNGHMINKAISEEVNSKKSDTIIFLEKILKKLPADFLSNPAMRELLNEYLGSSVLYFMDKDGNVDILGDQSDTYMQDDCRFSNDWWTKDYRVLSSFDRDEGYWDDNSDDCPDCRGFGIDKEADGECPRCKGSGFAKKEKRNAETH